MGLFDVDVLARRAGHDGRQRVPVVRRRDDHRVDVLVVQQLTEILVALGAGAAVGLRPLDARLVDVGNGHQLRFFDLFEVGDVPQPDQAAADEADLDAVVGAQYAAIGGGGRSAQKSST